MRSPLTVLVSVVLALALVAQASALPRLHDDAAPIYARAPARLGSKCTSSDSCQDASLYCSYSRCDYKQKIGATCYKDIGCKSNKCFQSHCVATAPRPAGSWCNDKSQCTSAYCAANQCRDKQANGATCTSNDACQSATCTNGRCAAPGGGAGGGSAGPKANGAACTKSTDCTSGNCDRSKCAAKKPDGSACYKDAGCVSGICDPVKKTCGKPAPPPLAANGAACTQSTQCASANCDRSKCAAKKPDGSACYKDAGCVSGKCDLVKKTCGSTATPPLAANGASCTKSTDCASANCDRSKCADKKANGVSCYKDAGCISGVCDLDKKVCAATRSPSTTATATTTTAAPQETTPTTPTNPPPVVPTPEGTKLVSNDFENGSLGSFQATGDVSVGSDPALAHSGDGYVKLGATPGNPATISQALPAEPAVTPSRRRRSGPLSKRQDASSLLFVSYWYSIQTFATDGGSGGSAATCTISTMLNGLTVSSTTVGPDSQTKLYVQSVISGSGASTSFTISVGCSAGASASVLIDDIAVVRRSIAPEVTSPAPVTPSSTASSSAATPTTSDAAATTTTAADPTTSDAATTATATATTTTTTDGSAPTSAPPPATGTDGMYILKDGSFESADSPWSFRNTVARLVDATRLVDASQAYSGDAAAKFAISGGQASQISQTLTWVPSTAAGAGGMAKRDATTYDFAFRYRLEKLDIKPYNAHLDEWTCRLEFYVGTTFFQRITFDGSYQAKDKFGINYGSNGGQGLMGEYKRYVKSSISLPPGGGADKYVGLSANCSPNTGDMVLYVDAVEFLPTGQPSAVTPNPIQSWPIGGSPTATATSTATTAAATSASTTATTTSDAPTTAPTPPAAPTSFVLPNGGFESGATGWTGRDFSISTNAHTGTNAMALHGSYEVDALISQPVTPSTAAAGRRRRRSVRWMRRQDTSASDSAADPGSGSDTASTTSATSYRVSLWYRVLSITAAHSPPQDDEACQIMFSSSKSKDTAVPIATLSSEAGYGTTPADGWRFAVSDPFTFPASTPAVTLFNSCGYKIDSVEILIDDIVLTKDGDALPSVPETTATATATTTATTSTATSTGPTSVPTPRAPESPEGLSGTPPPMFSNNIAADPSFERSDGSWDISSGVVMTSLGFYSQDEDKHLLMVETPTDGPHAKFARQTLRYTPEPGAIALEASAQMWYNIDSYSAPDGVTDGECKIELNIGSKSVFRIFYWSKPDVGFYKWVGGTVRLDDPSQPVEVVVVLMCDDRVSSDVVVDSLEASLKSIMPGPSDPTTPRAPETTVGGSTDVPDIQVNLLQDGGFEGDNSKWTGLSDPSKAVVSSEGTQIEGSRHVEVTVAPTTHNYVNQEYWWRDQDTDAINPGFDNTGLTFGSDGRPNNLAGYVFRGSLRYRIESFTSTVPGASCFIEHHAVGNVLFHEVFYSNDGRTEWRQVGSTKQASGGPWLGGVSIIEVNCQPGAQTVVWIDDVRLDIKALLKDPSEVPTPTDPSTPSAVTTATAMSVPAITNDILANGDFEAEVNTPQMWWDGPMSIVAEEPNHSGSKHLSLRSESERAGVQNTLRFDAVPGVTQYRVEASAWMRIKSFGGTPEREGEDFCRFFGYIPDSAFYDIRMTQMPASGADGVDDWFQIGGTSYVDRTDQVDVIFNVICSPGLTAEVLLDDVKAQVTPILPSSEGGDPTPTPTAPQPQPLTVKVAMDVPTVDSPMNTNGDFEGSAWWYGDGLSIVEAAPNRSGSKHLSLRNADGQSPSVATAFQYPVVDGVSHYKTQASAWYRIQSYGSDNADRSGDWCEFELYSNGIPLYHVRWTGESMPDTPATSDWVQIGGQVDYDISLTSFAGVGLNLWCAAGVTAEVAVDDVAVQAVPF